MGRGRTRRTRNSSITVVRNNPKQASQDRCEGAATIQLAVTAVENARSKRENSTTGDGHDHDGRDHDGRDHEDVYGAKDTSTRLGACEALARQHGHRETRSVRTVADMSGIGLNQLMSQTASFRQAFAQHGENSATFESTRARVARPPLSKFSA